MTQNDSSPNETDFGHLQLVRTRRGPMLANPLDAFIGRSLIEYGEHSELQLQEVLKWVRPGDFVMDVGANIGTNTIPLAQSVGPEGLVFAFEIQPFLLQTLCANAALNGLHNVRPFLVGLHETPGQSAIARVRYKSASTNFGGLSLHSLSHVSDESKETPLILETIDRLLQPVHPRPRLIKVDVEGLECAIIRGAKNTLRKDRPILYVENDRRENNRELVSLIRDANYDLFWHRPKEFNDKNFFNNPSNRLGPIKNINMLCIPSESEEARPHLQPVSDGVEDHPARNAK